MARNALILVFTNFLISFTLASVGSPTVFSGEEITIRNQWRVVIGSFLSASEVATDSTAVPVDVPGTWNDLQWEGDTFDGIGFGTYYTRIAIAKEMQGKPLALKIPEVSIAYALFIDGKHVGGCGQPGTSKDTEVPLMDLRIFNFETTHDTLTIVFHISNFRHESGGLWYEPTIGRASDIIHHYESNKTIKLLIAGCLLTAAIFQLYIFLRRRSERFGFYLTGICISLVTQSVTRGDIPLLDIFPNLSWIVLKKGIYISLFLLGPFNGLFLLELYPKYYNKKLIYGITYASLLASIFTLFVHPSISYSLVAPFQIITIATGGYLMVQLVKVALDDGFGSRFLLLGSTAAFLAAIHDILSSQYLIKGFTFPMIHIGMSIYVLQLILVQGSRYISLMRSKEKASLDLQKINENLESLVRDRTRDLEAKNDLISIQNKKLQKTMEEQEHLMAVVAHDLKAPFDNIDGLSQVLKRGVSGKPLELTEMISKSTEMGKNLISDLSEINYYERQDYQETRETFDLMVLLDEKRKTFQKSAAQKKITLLTSFSLTIEAFTSDRSILGRIIDNLLSNAIKFSHHESKISFEARQTEKDIIIAVEDFGPGFSEEDKKRMFKKFQRLSAKPTAGESSTGLGLSIVQTLVNRLHGVIHLEDKESTGARFVVKLPMYL